MRILRGSFFLSCFSLLFAFLVEAGALKGKVTKGDFSVLLELSSAHIKIGDEIVLDVQATSPAAYQLDAETLKNQLTQNINGISKHADIREEILSPHHLRYRVTFLITGNYVLNLFTIPFVTVDGKGAPVMLFDNMVPIVVEEAFKESKPLENFTAPLLPLSLQPFIAISDDNKALLEKSEASEPHRNVALFQNKIFPFFQVFAWMAGLLFILVIWKPLLKGMAWIKRKWKEPQNPKQEAMTALSTIGGIKDMPLNARYIALSDILCRYIEKQYQIPITKQTTPEFIQEITQKKLFPPSSSLLLQEFLKSADMVKFALYVPSALDCQNAQDAARTFIERN